MTDIKEPPTPVESESSWRIMLTLLADYMLLYDGYVALEKSRLCQHTDSSGNVILDVNYAAVPERPPYVIGGGNIGGGPWIEAAIHVADWAAGGIVGGATYDLVRRVRSKVAAHGARKRWIQFRRTPLINEYDAACLARVFASEYSARLLRRRIHTADLEQSDLVKLSRYGGSSVWTVSLREKDHPRSGWLGGIRDTITGRGSHDPLEFEVLVAADPRSWKDLRVYVRVELSLLRSRGLAADLIAKARQQNAPGRSGKELESAASSRRPAIGSLSPAKRNGRSWRSMFRFRPRQGPV